MFYKFNHNNLLIIIICVNNTLLNVFLFKYFFIIIELHLMHPH